jgi:DUF2946 family protein
MRTRRTFAWLALIGVLWTTMWPLVSAAHALAMSEPVPLCHQAGMMVAPDQSPIDESAPGHEGHFHCPLCIMAFFGAHFTPPTAPAPVFSVLSVVEDAYCAPMPSGIAVVLPPSRAPPSLIL